MLLLEDFGERYERDTIMVTASLPLDELSGVFGSEELTGAPLDHVTQLVRVPQMNGESSRLNQSSPTAVPRSANVPTDE